MPKSVAGFSHSVKEWLRVLCTLEYEFCGSLDIKGTERARVPMHMVMSVVTFGSVLKRS